MENQYLRGPYDSSRINIAESYEIQYWTYRFGVSPEELKAAVARASVSADAVEEYLKRTHNTLH